VDQEEGKRSWRQKAKDWSREKLKKTFIPTNEKRRGQAKPKNRGARTGMEKRREFKASNEEGKPPAPRMSVQKPSTW